MKLLHTDRTDLPNYVRRQLGQVIPLAQLPDDGLIDTHMGEALLRLNRCVSQVKLWTPGQFDILHSTQYCMFLYYLSNTIWRHEGEQGRDLCTRLFLLNKALNAIDCFYEVALPEVFFIGHSVGIVLAKATYGNHLVLYQNSTVGKNHGTAPVLEDGVVMYPNTAIIGNCLVRAGSVISQGVSVINANTELNHLVFAGAGGALFFKPSARPIQADFFRDIS